MAAKASFVLSPGLHVCRFRMVLFATLPHLTADQPRKPVKNPRQNEKGSGRFLPCVVLDEAQELSELRQQ